MADVFQNRKENKGAGEKAEVVRSTQATLPERPGSVLSILLVSSQPSATPVPGEPKPHMRAGKTAICIK